ARLLSIIPGAAHFYTGSNKAGTWLLGSALVGTALLTSPDNRGLGVLVIGIPLTVSIIDGPRSVQRYNSRLPTREQLSQLSISYSGEHHTGMVTIAWAW
ncbi:MAG: hypothetical protein NWF07_09875, partial [Candidatus Bathyarchaeota archaeon]|nr:hypothetical protein [Candidatus Bathyarchaeota archaeon]